MNNVSRDFISLDYIVIKTLTNKGSIALRAGRLCRRCFRRYTHWIIKAGHIED
jgi:hypothetical protein